MASYILAKIGSSNGLLTDDPKPLDDDFSLIRSSDIHPREISQDLAINH